MKSLDFGRCALGICAAAAMLAGCGGSQPPIGAPGAMPQASALATHAERGTSWMLPEARSEDLLYTSNDDGDVYVYSYPAFKQVGELQLNEATQGLCVDKQSDVFVPAWTGDVSTLTGYIYEYAHGGTQPIATLSDPGALNTSCSVDPTTGNLAVTNAYQSGYDYGNVAIYPNASGSPTTYVVTDIEPGWSAYDGNGDLFVDGYHGGSASPLAELPKGSSTFSSVTLNKSISTESLQWEKGYLTIASATNNLGPLYIYRVHISASQGTIVGSTALTMRHLGYDGNGQYWIQGDRVLGAGLRHSRLQIWRYPAGGDAVKTVVKRFTPWGVVVSAAASGTHIRK
jgi:hypothetical protein